MKKKDIKEFIKKRICADLNNVKGKELQDYIDNCTIDNFSGFKMIDDGSHSYLIVKPENKHYTKAKEFESNYSKRYRLQNGTILLEEDCDATAFLTAIKA